MPLPVKSQGRHQGDRSPTPSRLNTRVAVWILLVLIAVSVAAGMALVGFRRRAASTGPVWIDPHHVDGLSALDEVRRLVELGPRHAGTPGAERAARHIADRLKALGIRTIIEEFRDATPRGEAIFRNVLGVLPGTSDSIIVLLSHYDTKAGISKTFAGANDSGSSTGLLLELARVLHRCQPLPCSFLLAFLDGEECQVRYAENDGLHGSRYLASRMKVDGRARDVRAVLLLDMVGDANLTVTVPRNSSPVLVSLLFDAAREEGVRDKFSLAPIAILDDHVPFLLAGMPAVNVIDFQYGSLPGKNDYWHSVQDTMDRLSHRSLETVGRVVIRLINRLTGAAHPIPSSDRRAARP